MGTSDYAALEIVQRVVQRLTGGIRFATFNSPFTHTSPNQVLQRESVAAKIGFRPAWFRSARISQLASKAAGGITIPSPSMTVTLWQVSRSKSFPPEVGYCVNVSTYFS